MLSRRSFVLTAIVASAIPWQQAVAAVAPEHVDGATKFIDSLANQAIAVLRNDSTSLEAREATFRDLLSNGFDVPFIGRFVLGRHWRTASDEQRDDYLGLFTEFLLKTYSRRLGGYAGEAFTVVGARSSGKKDVIVRTRIDRPSGPDIKADWRVRVRNEQYKIIDVAVEGVSMAVTQRSEFASVVRTHGMDGLLQALRMRTQMYTAKAS